MKVNYKRLFHQLILSLSKTLDIDEARKLNHAQRTAVLSHLLASRICPEESSSVYYAALLHDIGGIGLFDHIVHHPSPEEQASNSAIRVHPIVGAQIVDNIPVLENCVSIIANHHERFDGHGYPSGKSGDKISLGAQIVRCADAFDICIFGAKNVDSIKLDKIFASKSGHEISSDMASLMREFINDRETFSLLIDGSKIQDRCLDLEKHMAFEVPQRVDIIGTLLEVFAQVIDTKHSYTAGHSLRVAKYSVQIGLALNLEHDEITRLKWAALIHDLGKVAVPRSILDGLGSLTQEEVQIIRRHPKYTIEVLSCVSELKELAYIGAYHHERWDGRGYPSGLKGEEIPLSSRIICVADSFDSLTSDRSYHKALGSKEALTKLEKDSGSQFDADVFNTAKKVLWSGKD